MIDEIFLLNLSFLSQFLREKNSTEICDWIFSGLATKTFSGLIFNDRISIAHQFYRLYKKLNDSEKEVLRKGFISVFSKWDNNQPQIILDTSIFLSKIEDISVVHEISKILIENQFDCLQKDDYLYYCGNLVRLLLDFCPSEEIKKIFYYLYQSEISDPKIFGNLFLGLCICDPENFVDYVPRFLNTIEIFPNSFPVDLIISKLLNVINLNSLETCLNELILIQRNSFIAILNNNRKYIDFIDSNKNYDAESRLILTFNDREKLRKKLFELSYIDNNIDQDADVRDPVIRFSLNYLIQNINCQIASIYLFSKKGKLIRKGIDGFSFSGTPIKNNLKKDSYSVENEFKFFISDVVKTGSIQRYIPPDLEKDDLFLDAYRGIVDKINCGIAIPLNGRTATFGVLVLINKVEPNSKKTLDYCYEFSKQEIDFLSYTKIAIETALSNCRINRQSFLRRDLLAWLETGNYSEKNVESVYQRIVQRLTSKYTSFSVCILRNLDLNDNKLVVVKRYGVKDKDQDISIDIDSRGKEEDIYIKHSNESISSPNYLERLRDKHLQIVEEGIPQWACRTATPVTCFINAETIDIFGDKKDWVLANELKSYACFPLISRRRLVGTMSLYSSYEYNFHKSANMFLFEICHTIASFFRRYQETKRNVKYIDDVNRLSLASPDVYGEKFPV